MALSLSVRKKSREYSTIEERAHLGIPKAVAVPTQEPTDTPDAMHVCDAVTARGSDSVDPTTWQALTTSDVGGGCMHCHDVTITYRACDN